MSNNSLYLDKTEITEELIQALSQKNSTFIQQTFETLVPEDIAEILEATPPKERHKLWTLVNREIQGEVIVHTNDEVKASLLQQLDENDIVEITEDLETDDITDIAQGLPDYKKEKLLNNLSYEDRSAVEIALSYPEDTAGGLMSTDIISIRSDVTLEVVLRLLRKLGEIPENTVDLIVKDRTGHYQGLLAINDLITHPEYSKVSQLVKKIPAITANLNYKEVAHLFEKNDLISIVVIDSKNMVIGRITIDDVVDIIREEAEKTQMASAGLNDEDDLFTPAFKSSKRRSFWLGINLLTAIFASIIIGFFGASIKQIVALAILMPIVASMGGIAGTQTATIVIRALATGKLGYRNSRHLLIKEAKVGLLNGLLWSTVTGTVTALWFDNTLLGVIFGAAMLINLTVAALAGALIPLILNRMKIDPALASGLMLTTVTDTLGFFVFLGLATIVLL